MQVVPLANRVDPLGDLCAVPARGMFTGNRGIIHDPTTRSTNGRRWSTRAWIVCRCDYGGRRRDVWSANGRDGRASWSELFFLDEVTALAAGHRPCFFCRREAAKRFQAAFAAGNGLDRAGAPQMDERLHAERRLSRKAPAVRVRLDALPDGAMAETGAGILTRRAGIWLRWSFEGYQRVDPPGADGLLITPRSTVAALEAGFRPVCADGTD